LLIDDSEVAGVGSELEVLVEGKKQDEVVPGPIV
jgi:hypothetical protein